jgi:hypothetical protein
MATNFGRTQILLREGAAPMTSAPVRDPLSDHLLTPQNAALLLIDFQPQQLGGVHSMDRDLLVKNAVSTVKTTKPSNSRSCTRPPTSPPAGDSQPSPNPPTC